VDRVNQSIDIDNNSEDERLLVRISWLYYVEELTQQQIGDRLGLSRIKVNRLLSQARRAGIVEIRINAAFSLHVEMEHKLCTLYNLRDAVIVPDTSPGESTYLALAQGVSDWLTPRLNEDLKIGLSIGRTISHLPLVFRSDQKVNCTFVETMGGAANYTGSFEQYNVISRMAELAGGRASYFYAPTIVSNPEVRQTLLAEESIDQALEMARNCDIVIQSAGSIQDGALLREYNHITNDDLEDLRQRGAVGDVLCQYIDAQGNALPGPVDGRVVSLTLDDLRQIPWSVGVGGIDKFEVIRAALRGSIFNVLITDVSTARLLIDSP
jgi:DNA-binding transcriptional regulator LsrR (DeoR family)